ncbi:MAG: flagellar motor protein MotB [Lachnospiraceae bacterium]|nr:flagellar motor protein MotB [Lachnospiraceae bacterium]
MARKKKEEAAKGGSPAWMATFSDLMNLLLCFFVLLFSMSTVDAEKFEMVIASLQSSFNILPAGGSSIGEGQLISSGISQLENFDIYYHESTNSKGDEEGGSSSDEEDVTSTEDQNQSSEQMSEEDIEKAYESQSLAESEKMAEQIEQQLSTYGVQDQVEVDFNAEYVLLTLNGAILFDSGQADIRADAVPLVDKIGKILEIYDRNIIDIEGHTDNVPITRSTRFENNNVLSMYRALTVADHIRATTSLNPAYIVSSGRGEYVPVADNATEEGRARNRRVEIKIYNSYNSTDVTDSENTDDSTVAE